MYGYEKIGKVKSVRCKVHEYSPMNLDYTEKVEVKMYMRKYVIITISEFPMNIEKVQAVTISAT